VLVTLWFLATLVFAALLLGTTFAHTLQMPAKLRYDGPQWMRAQHTLYRSFATVGGAVEAGAIILSVGLVFLVRQDRWPFLFVLVAAACLAAAFFGIWILVTRAVNAETATWTAETIPVDWSKCRARWEYSHAARFALHLAAFILLTTAALLTTPFA
jgi:hypothetical protein